MGFCFASDRTRALTEDYAPTITPGEYASELSGVMAMLAERREPRCHRCQLGLRYLATGLPDAAIGVFSSVLRRHPSDEHAHRLLGVTFLYRGDIEPAVTHLELALGLVRRNAAGAIGLGEMLRLRCEAALLRVVLVRLYMKLGQVQAVRRLVREGQEVL